MNFEALTYLWLLSHEEAYSVRPTYQVLLNDGRLLLLNQHSEAIEELMPTANWIVPDLPLLEIAGADSTIEKHGIIVDPKIAEKLRLITSLLLGDNRHALNQLQSANS